jgi:hypothetical protein
MVIGFTEHLDFANKINYDAIAISQILQFPTASTKSSQSAVFIKHSLVTDPNNVLCFRAQVLTDWKLFHN